MQQTHNRAPVWATAQYTLTCRRMEGNSLVSLAQYIKFVYIRQMCDNTATRTTKGMLMQPEHWQLEPKGIERFRTPCEEEPNSMVAIVLANFGMPTFVQPTMLDDEPMWQVSNHSMLMPTDVYALRQEVNRAWCNGQDVPIYAINPEFGHMLELRAIMPAGRKVTKLRSPTIAGFRRFTDEKAALRFLVELGARRG